MKYLLLLSLLLATGCRMVDQGIPLDGAATKFMVPGTTTYQEVTAELGPPLLFVDGERVVAYRWQTRYGNYYFNDPALNLVGIDKSGPIHQRYEALALRFDDQGLLQVRSFFSEPDLDKLRQQLNTWAKPPSTNP